MTVYSGLKVLTATAALVACAATGVSSASAAMMPGTAATDASMATKRTAKRVTPPARKAPAKVAPATAPTRPAGNIVTDDIVPDAPLRIPGNVTVYGKTTGVYRPSAIVNGEIVTATDIEQRLALVRVANRGASITPEEEKVLRQQIFANLIDEKLQLQEARANKIDVEEAMVDDQFARIARQNRMTSEQFATFLSQNGSSSEALRQQIRGEMAWDRLQGRNIEPVTNVSKEEVQAQFDRMKAARGTDEFRIGEIYLTYTPETAAATEQTAQRIIEQIQRGVSFPALARQFSQASTAGVGGDLGWVRAGQIPPSIAAAVEKMAPSQVAGPIATPGGISIVMLIERRKFLMADPRNALLSLKQISLPFAPGLTQAQVNTTVRKFTEATQKVAGCGAVDDVARTLGASVASRDQLPMSELPPQLQAVVGNMQVGQATPPFGSAKDGVSVLVLCGRDLPEDAGMPTVAEVEEQLRSEKVHKRAQRYLRDLRRDAIIEYS